MEVLGRLPPQGLQGHLGVRPLQHQPPAVQVGAVTQGIEGSLGTGREIKHSASAKPSPGALLSVPPALQTQRSALAPMTPAPGRGEPAAGTSISLAGDVPRGRAARARAVNAAARAWRWVWPGTACGLHPAARGSARDESRVLPALDGDQAGPSFPRGALSLTGPGDSGHLSVLPLPPHCPLLPSHQRPGSGPALCPLAVFALRTPHSAHFPLFGFSFVAALRYRSPAIQV